MRHKKSPSKPHRHLPSKKSSGRGASLVSHQVGALPLLNRIIERLKLRGFLETYVPSLSRDSRYKVSVADTLLVLLRNILCSREPMYGVGEWAAPYAAELLGLEERQVEALNDDRVGRALDCVFDSEYPTMLVTIVRHALQEFDVSLDQLHNDSTTVTFYGKYEDARPGGEKHMRPTLGITWGHNKDHRPDLKQLLYILTVSDDGAVPIHFRPEDGNVTDDRTHQQSWEVVRELNDGDPSFLYVADSKLATKENMAYIDGQKGRFVTVLPRTRSEDAAFRELLQEHPIDLGKEIHRVKRPKSKAIDVYHHAQHPTRTSEGYPLYWFHSSRKQELDRVSRSDRLEQATQELYSLRDRLRSPRTRFRDEAKVRAEVEDILKRRRVRDLLRVSVIRHEEEDFRQTGPGRPGPNTRYRREVRERFDLHVEIDDTAVAVESLSDGFFPLVTNDESLQPVDVLVAYKGQPHVEKRFSQLKSDFAIAPVFLKSASRVEGLFCTYFLAILVQALFEREVKLRMERVGVESVPIYPEGRPCRRPTVRRVVDLFGNIQRHVINPKTEDESIMQTALSDSQRAILDVLGIRESDLH